MRTLILCAVALFLAGCGHNAVTYGDGVQAELGFIPDQYKIALTFRYGKIFSAAVKERAKVTLTTDADNSGVQFLHTGVRRLQCEDNISFSCRDGNNHRQTDKQSQQDANELVVLHS